MSYRDQVSNQSSVSSLHSALRTAAAQGTGIDLRGYDSCVFQCGFGAVADGYFTFVLQESDAQSSGFSTIAAADLMGTPPSAFGESPDAGVDTVTEVGYQGTKRYVRVTVVQGLSPAPGTGAQCFGLVQRGHAHQRPA